MKLPEASQVSGVKLTPRMKKLIPWIGYPIAYLFFFVCFAYWTFPYEKLKQKIIVGYAASQQGSPEPKRMQIGDVTWSWRFPGVVLKDVRLIGPKPPAAPDKPPALDKSPGPDKKAKPRTVINIDEAYAGLSVLPLIAGARNVIFEVEGFGGGLSGEFETSPAATELSVQFDGVDPGQLPGLADALQLPLTGSLSGTVDVVLPEGKYALADGEADLQAEELEVGDGVSKIRGMLALPTIRAGDLSIVATATQGRVKLERFDSEGPDLEVKAAGKLRLREPFALSSVEQIDLSFKFTDAYRDKDDVTRSLLGKPGTKQKGVIDLDPKVRRAKAPDGTYYWKASGRFATLNFAPSKPAPTPRAKSAATGARATPNPPVRPAAPKRPTP